MIPTWKITKSSNCFRLALGVWDQEADSDTPLEKAEKAAKRYYTHTVFDVVSLEVKTRSEEEIIFTVKASRGGYIVEPDRKILVKLQDGEWKMTNEGY